MCIRRLGGREGGEGALPECRDKVARNQSKWRLISASSAERKPLRDGVALLLDCVAIDEDAADGFVCTTRPPASTATRELRRRRVVVVAAERRPNCRE